MVCLFFSFILTIFILYIYLFVYLFYFLLFICLFKRPLKGKHYFEGIKHSLENCLIWRVNWNFFFLF